MKCTLYWYCKDDTVQLCEDYSTELYSAVYCVVVTECELHSTTPFIYLCGNSLSNPAWSLPPDVKLLRCDKSGYQGAFAGTFLCECNPAQIFPLSTDHSILRPWYHYAIKGDNDRKCFTLQKGLHVLRWPSWTRRWRWKASQQAAGGTHRQCSLTMRLVSIFSRILSSFRLWWKR